MARDYLSNADIALIKDAFGSVKLTLHNQTVTFHLVSSNITSRFRDTTKSQVTNYTTSCAAVYLTEDDDEALVSNRNQGRQKVRIELIMDDTLRASVIWDAASRTTKLKEESDFFTLDGRKYKILYSKLSGFFDTQPVTLSVVGQRNEQLDPA